jgi:hypothetical protein
MQPHTLEYRPAHEYDEDDMTSNTGTSASDPDGDVRRMLAEQRAIAAEHARPDPAVWGVDEKKKKKDFLEQKESDPRTTLAPTQSLSHRDTDAASSAGGHPNPDPDPEMSSIAAQMRALQAQMSRLQVERELPGGSTPLQLQYPSEAPPPAYAGL